MCGIAGFLNIMPSSASQLTDIASKMGRQLIHRGPDDDGVWVDPEVGIALAHRRLSILDLSDSGHQPMASNCGRYRLIFNGEIYNHIQIREKLSSARTHETLVFRGRSDTETLLSAIANWGVEATVKELNGMFAFAVWDRLEKTLYLTRDRMGEKPLYYCLSNGSLVFGSELKALKEHPGIKFEVDRKALSLFMSRSFIPSPYSIYKDVFKLSPSTMLKINLDDISKGCLQRPTPYWSFRKVALSGQDNMFQGDEEDATIELESILKSAVLDQMNADVPLGAFLSGGIDSSTIVALMQKQSSRPIQTFTVGFEEAEHNEASHAKSVAHHLGTQHNEMFVTPSETQELMPQIGNLYDEPFADVSQVPTFLVSKLAKNNVTVCLSGDGGDELFGGYNRHASAASFWRGLGWLPYNMRKKLSWLLTNVSPTTWNDYHKYASILLPQLATQKFVGDKLHKLALILQATSGDDVYHRIVSKWQGNEGVVKNAQRLAQVISDVEVSDLAEMEHRLMFLDATTYLPDNILVKVDRAAMGVSLETRIPMLDHRVIDFAWSLPLQMKVRNHTGKIILRKVLARHVPPELTGRPKAGFGVPIDGWLRGSLKKWAEDLLDENKIRQQDYLCYDEIKKKWHDHQDMKRNWSQDIWNVLMFQHWLNKNS